MQIEETISNNPEKIERVNCRKSLKRVRELVKERKKERKKEGNRGYALEVVERKTW